MNETIYPYQNLELTDMEGEEWRPIKDYEGIYEVSNLGRIKSLGNDRSRKDKIRKQFFNGIGYLRVSPSKDGKKKNILVHRLVAQAFLEDYSDELEVNHIDEDKCNNCISNLEMMTHKANLNHGTHNERIAKARSKQVAQYDLKGTLLAIYPSTRECQRNGFNCGSVSQCCRNEYSKNRPNIYKGSIWQYI